MRDFNDNLTKSDVRRRYRELLCDVRGADRVSDSGTIQNAIAGLPQWSESLVLIGYCATGHEVPVDGLMERFLARPSGRLLLPRYEARTDSYGLVAVSEPGRDLVKGRYGILEPREELPAVSDIGDAALWLVPGIAFSVSGGRLGRGRGYYDRLFASFPTGFRVGVAWQCQMAAALPASEWDGRMAVVVTEQKIYPAV